MVTSKMSHLLASSFNNRKKLADGDSSTTTVTTTTAPTVFQSNLACVLNDPKKARAEISTFFTKTWGNSFVDRLPDPLTRLGDYSLNDFETYFNSLRKSEKYGRPRLRQLSSNDSNASQKTNSVINIPQLFFSPQFTLSDTSTFNLVFPGIIPVSRPLSPIHFEQQKTRTTSTSSDKSEGTYRRQSTSSTSNNKSITNGTVSVNVSTSSSPKHSISSTTRLLQDKYTHYLDEVELLITRALSTKSHCFHDAVRSHDEIQSFLNTTRHAISSLRGELLNYDSQSLLTLLRLYRLLRQRQNQRQLLKRLESLSVVKQTHMQVRALLTTKFGQSLTNQLLTQQDLTLSNDYIEEDKLITILIGLIRVKDEKYIDEIRSKFEQFMLDIIERAISSNSKDNFLEKSNKTTIKNNSEQSSLNEESSTTHRYTYLSTINSNSGSFSSWIRSINLILKSTEHGLNRLRNLSQYISDALLKHQLNNIPSITLLLHNIYDIIEERLTIVLTQECTRYQVHFERLSLDEYAQMVKSIENFILNVNGYDKKYKSRPLKTFLQSQTSKFLTHFHDERKQRVAQTLDNEQWKQVPVPRSIQNSIDELFNLSSSINPNGSETLIIDNESFVLSNSALHLFMLVLDYCSCAQLLASSSINDVEHRLIELLNLFNSKTCQLVLGAGAVKLGKIKTISAKVLAITCRCLQFIKITLPKIKAHFDQLQIAKSRHFMFIIASEYFIERSSQGEHSDNKPLQESDLILLFTRLNSIFKQLLAKRLRQLRIANDGGPQHGLLTSDLLYYIKQVQNFPGLEMLELHVDEIWTAN
ncbi:unnamed protein product [Rotaria sp. Silwood2]|nr:unnamed protein product [Rotaria sp. Silwood2]